MLINDDPETTCDEIELIEGDMKINLIDDLKNSSSCCLETFSESDLSTYCNKSENASSESITGSSSVSTENEDGGKKFKRRHVFILKSIDITLNLTNQTDNQQEVPRIHWAQEQWPNDVKLFQPYEMEQILLPDNANCLAVQAFLRMCQLPYQVEWRSNAEAMSPTGKVPFIKCGAFVVSELEGIVQFANNRGITLTGELSNEEKSDMRAYMCLVHNVLEKAELYICWMDEETYNGITCVRNGSVYPWPLNHIQNWTKRRAVMKNLKVWNWYDKKLEEVYQEVENACQALSDRLDDKEYFFDKRPTELDALVFGHLFTILTTPLSSDRFANIPRKYPSLISLIQRIEKKYFNKVTKHEKE